MASSFIVSWSLSSCFIRDSPSANSSSGAKGDILLDTLSCHFSTFEWKWTTSILSAVNVKSLAGVGRLRKSSAGSPKLTQS